MTKMQPQDNARPSKNECQRLRAIAESAKNANGRALRDVFELGAKFEEAAELLRGTFSSWVRQECELDPRTAFGFRKAHTVLAEHREMLLKRKVSPSVVVLIAGAEPEARKRALASIKSGRSLTAREARIVLRGTVPDQPKSPADALKRAARSGADRLTSEIAALEEAVLSPECSDEDRRKLASKAARLFPIAFYLFGEDGNADAILEKLRRWADGDFATAFDTTAEDGAMDHAKDDEADVAQSSASAVRLVPTLDCLEHPYKHDLTVLELFAGAGGMAAGLTQAGFRHAALVEYLPHACETLRAAFGSEHVVETDVRSYKPERAELGPIDLLSGGPPCQPFSVSGERGGSSDKRDMFPEFLRLVGHLKPRSILIENVEGLFHAPFDFDRFQIQARLKRMGYSTEWRTVNATHFGVAQNRIRSILVGFRDKDAMARFVWPTATHSHYVYEPLTVDDVLRDLFCAKGWSPTEKVVARMSVPAPTLTGGSDKKCGADLGQQNSREVWEKMGFVGTRIGREAPKVDHKGPIEITNAMCAELQGFPSRWPFAGGHVAVYKQIANAFPPPVARLLGCAIASALTGTTVDHHAYRASRAVPHLHALLKLRRENRLISEAAQIRPPITRPRPAQSLDLRSLQASSEMIEDHDELVWWN